jgi:hypothetical protein
MRRLPWRSVENADAAEEADFQVARPSDLLGLSMPFQVSRWARRCEIERRVGAVVRTAAYEFGMAMLRGAPLSDCNRFSSARQSSDG